MNLSNLHISSHARRGATTWMIQEAIFLIHIRIFLRKMTFSKFAPRISHVLNNHLRKRTYANIAELAHGAVRCAQQDTFRYIRNISVLPYTPQVRINARVKPLSRRCPRAAAFPMNSRPFARELSRFQKYATTIRRTASWLRATTRKRLCRPTAIMSEVVDYGYKVKGELWNRLPFLYLKDRRRRPGIVSSDLWRGGEPGAQVAGMVNYPVSTLRFIVIGRGVIDFSFINHRRGRRASSYTTSSKAKGAYF